MMGSVWGSRVLLLGAHRGTLVDHLDLPIPSHEWNYVLTYHPRSILLAFSERTTVLFVTYSIVLIYHFKWGSGHSFFARVCRERSRKSEFRSSSVPFRHLWAGTFEDNLDEWQTASCQQRTETCELLHAVSLRSIQLPSFGRKDLFKIDKIRNGNEQVITISGFLVMRVLGPVSY